jgi:hypothetical protein
MDRIQEDRLRPLFERLRAADARDIPSFEQILGRPAGGGGLRLMPGRLIRVSLGAAALLLVPASYCVFTQQRARPELATADLALLYWRSPTESLLSEPDEYASQAPASALAGGNQRSQAQ